METKERRWAVENASGRRDEYMGRVERMVWSAFLRLACGTWHGWRRDEGRDWARGRRRGR